MVSQKNYFLFIWKNHFKIERKLIRAKIINPIEDITISFKETLKTTDLVSP